MKQFFTLALFLLSFQILSGQNVKVRGMIYNSESGKGIPNAKVTIGSRHAVTDAGGIFEVPDASVGSQRFSVTAEDFDSTFMTVDLKGPFTDLGSIRLRPSQIYNSESGGLSEVNSSSLDFEDDSKSQYISSLLHSTSDVFVSTAGYTLGAAYFRIRGYDSENSSIYINGVPVNDAESGRPVFSEWGGLNDVMRNKEVVNGLASCDFSFGNVGGTTNIVTRASQIRKQNKLSYAYSNRAYNHRIMYTYSTGLMQNGWAFAVSGSHRWAQEGYVEGTFYDAWAYFLSAEKKLNDRHSLNFTVFSAPTIRGMQAGSTQEAYDLTGTNYYNPNWGYQQGEKRNAKVRTTNSPMLILSHYWTPGKKTRITNSLSYSYGKMGTTALNWYNAPDPRPDYYRYLPSYATNTGVIKDLTTLWQSNDPSVTQINWDKIYQINYLAAKDGKQSSYIIEDRRQDQSQINLDILLNHEITSRIKLSGGLDLQKYTGYHFKVMSDLLGGNYWKDIDQFAERDFSGDTIILQNDLNNPNRIIYKGDKFGYNYNIEQMSGALWGQIDASFNKVDVYGALNLSYTSFYRDGKMRNGRAPDNSYGKGKVNNFFDYGIKAGVTYKITGSYFLVANAAYMTNAPSPRNSYVSPMVKADVMKDLKSEKIISGDLNFIWHTDRFNGRITAYQTFFNDESKIMSYYHDSLQTYVNMSMTGIDKIHQGIEFGADFKATKALNVTAVANFGNYLYTSRPTEVISVENGSVADQTKTVYGKNFFISGTPQTAGSLGIRYAFPKFWYFNANLNYFDKMYLDFNPERRTTTAISGYGPGDPMITTITEQQKLNHGFTLDASVGKSISLKKFYVTLNFSVSNILDNQDLITGGYEQLRFDFAGKNVNKFPPKYFYANGRTFYLTASIRI